MTTITIQDVTTKVVGGTGSFDVLMTAAKAHLEQEFEKHRIKGPEYSTVYLGAMTQAMQLALQFEKTKADIELTTKQIEKETAQIALVDEQKALITAQIAQITAETANVPKQGAVLDQQALNEAEQFKVITATECKLKAEYNVLVLQQAKVTNESELLAQKKVTEQAQTVGSVIDANSILGKQNALYTAQTAGYARDSELKAAKTMIDSWNVRRGTDAGTTANGTNNLQDSDVGRAVSKMLSGVGA